MSQYTVSYPSTDSLSASLTVCLLPLVPTDQTAPAAAATQSPASKCYCTLTGRHLKLYKSKHDKSALQTYDLSNADIRVADNSCSFQLLIPAPSAKLQLTANSETAAQQWIDGMQSISLNSVENEIIDLTDDDLVANELQAAQKEQLQFDRRRDMQHVMHSCCWFEQCTIHNLLQCAADHHTDAYLLFYLDVQLYQLQCHHLLHLPSMAAIATRTELLTRCQQSAEYIHDRYIATHVLPGQQHSAADTLSDFDPADRQHRNKADAQRHLKYMTHLFDQQVDFALKPLTSLLWPAWLTSRYLQLSQLGIQSPARKHDKQSAVAVLGEEYWKRAQDVLSQVPHEIQQQYLQAQMDSSRDALTSVLPLRLPAAHLTQPDITPADAVSSHTSVTNLNPFDDTTGTEDHEFTADSEEQLGLAAQSPSSAASRSRRASINPFDEDTHPAEITTAAVLSSPAPAAALQPAVSLNPFALSDADTLDDEASDNNPYDADLEAGRHCTDVNGAEPLSQVGTHALISTAHNPFDSDCEDADEARAEDRVWTGTATVVNDRQPSSLSTKNTTVEAIGGAAKGSDNPFVAEEANSMTDNDTTPHSIAADDSAADIAGASLPDANLVAHNHAVNPFDDDADGHDIAHDETTPSRLVSSPVSANAAATVRPLREPDYEKELDELKDLEVHSTAHSIIAPPNGKARKVAKSNYSEWRKLAQQRKAGHTVSRR